MMFCKLVKQSVLSAILGMMLLPAFADEYKKNGLPCVAEICIGDGLEEMARVKWEDKKLKLKKEDLNQLPQLKTDGYRGDLTAAIPYLSSAVFDNTALPALAKVIAHCESNSPIIRSSLNGRFTTASGILTEVQIAIEPNINDTKIHRWLVVGISRHLPSAITKAQKHEAGKQLRERYREIDGAVTTLWNPGDPLPKRPNFGEGRFYYDDGYFSLSYVDYDELHGNRRDLLKLHPLCGGTKKVQID